MSKKVEIRSNILSDIVKIRKGVVYKNPETIIDELFQNCQRSKATTINFNLNGDTLTVIDNGIGCDDPQAVFEKNTTAWLEEEEAFGEGFFSLFLLADYMKLSSQNWEIEVDVLKVLSTGDLSLEAVETKNYVNGFQVIVQGKAVAGNDYELHREAQVLGKIIPQDVYINDQEVEKVALLEEPDDKFSYCVDNSIYEAVLTPENSFSYVKLFYEFRPVTSHYKNGVGGTIHFKKGGVTVKAPDRKDIVYDKKHSLFTTQLQVDVANMYKAFIRQASDTDIDKYATAIFDYVDVTEYLNLLTVDETMFDLLRYVPESEKSQDIIESSGINVQQAAQNLEATIKSLNVDVVSVDIPQDAPEKEKVRTKKTRLVDIIDKDAQLTWVRPDEVSNVENLIGEMKQINFRVIVARNKLYEAVFEHFGIPHIESLEENIEREFIIANTGPRSKKERRFLALMRIIEQEMELPPNTIDLADIGLQLAVSRGDQVFDVEIVDAEGCFQPNSNKIFIGRQGIDFPKYRAQDPDYPKVTVHDYKVLLQVLDTLAHEMAHMLYASTDNTKFHFDMTALLSRQIARLF